MSGPISYVKGVTWEAAGDEDWKEYIEVSAEATGLPSKFWLRGLQFCETAGTRIDNPTYVDLFNGNGSSRIKLFRLYNGIQMSPNTAILPEDCYWNVDQGLYLYANGDDETETKAFIYMIAMTLFFTA